MYQTQKLVYTVYNTYKYQQILYAIHNEYVQTSEI